VKVDMTLAVPVGLICNELITNSFKHAFKGNKGGKVTISLKDLSGFVEVSVTDSGRGLPEGFTMESSQSLGMTLLQVLTQQVKGEMRAINDDGARFVLTFPADHKDNKKAKKKTGS
jgi:two-component sensor histidine kinase